MNTTDTAVKLASPSYREQREAWAQHPHWPEQVLLVGSHDNFRHISQLIMRELADEAVPRHAERLFRRWMMAMGGHEHYEEHKLYRYLTHRTGESMAHLQAGHDELHARRAEVYAAFDAVIEARDNSGAEGDRLREAYAAFHEVLIDHLALEEATVIPKLLDLEPQEFARFTSTRIERLLAEAGYPGASAAS